MAESMPHKSSFTVGGVNAMSWTGQDGTVHRRVVFEIRGVMVLPVESAREFTQLLRDAIRDATESA